MKYFVEASDLFRVDVIKGIIDIRFSSIKIHKRSQLELEITSSVDDSRVEKNRMVLGDVEGLFIISMS